MKKRLGFISNSSSSSFIVFGEEPKVPCMKLEPELAKRVIESINKEHAEMRKTNGGNELFSEFCVEVVWDGKEDVYLTSYLSDCGEYTECFENLRHFSYGEGSVGGGPYEYKGKKDKYLVKISGDPLEEDDKYNEDYLEDVFVKKMDLDPTFKIRTFLSQVKKLAEIYDIKDYSLKLK